MSDSQRTLMDDLNVKEGEVIKFFIINKNQAVPEIGFNFGN